MSLVMGGGDFGQLGLGEWWGWFFRTQVFLPHRRNSFLELSHNLKKEKT